MKNPLPALLVFVALLSASGGQDPVTTFTLSAADLSDGYRADHLRLSDNGQSVVLDLRNIEKEFSGTLETDVLDPLHFSGAGITDLSEPVKISIKTAATLPPGTRLTLSVKTGSGFFSEKGWTGWVAAQTPEAVIGNPHNRYFKLRYEFSTDDKSRSPALSSVTVSFSARPAPKFSKPVTVTSFENRKIPATPHPFVWERPDNPDILKFLGNSGYGDAYAKGKTELEKFTLLSKQVAATKNDRTVVWSKDYPWDANQLCAFGKDGMAVKGHCMSYAAVLVAAFTGLHQYARHWSVNGFRDMTHEVVEVWSNSLNKWIYLDPSLSQYYLDPKTQTPLSILEMHNILVNFMFKDGEDMKMAMDDQKKRVKALGGGKKAPIVCVDDGWHYGAPGAKDYDWGWLHGYMADGFMRLTTRNNFISQKEPWFSYFGEGLNYDVFLTWVDRKTPPCCPEVRNYSGRVRDFWSPLNQASIKARRKTEKTIELEFGNSQPFFKKYIVTLNNGAPAEAASPYAWELKEGTNEISVVPEDEWGTKGLASSLKVSY